MCLVEEMRFLMMLIGTAGPAWTLQVIAFDLVINRIRNVAHSTAGRLAVPDSWLLHFHHQLVYKYGVFVWAGRESGSGKRTDDAYEGLRCIQLYIGMVNAVNRNLICTWKLLCLGMSIGSGFAAIAHFKDHPVFGAMYYMLFFDCSIFYCLLYGKAFKISVLFEDAKTILLLRGTNLVGRDWRRRSCCRGK